MKTSFRDRQSNGLTMLEVLIVVAVLAILAMLVLPALANAKARSIRLCCVNSLKQTGLAFRIWAGDNGDNYPMAVSKTSGGTMELTTGPNAFRHFQVMSNEL